MVKTRNWTAIAAWFRRAGPMKHKNAPRGGASNESRDLLDQADRDDHLFPPEPSEAELLDEAQQRAINELFEADSKKLGEAAVEEAKEK